MRYIGFLTMDLMFLSQVSAAAKANGATLVTGTTWEQIQSKLPEGNSISSLVVDLTLSKLDLPAIAATAAQQDPKPTLIAYGPHVQEGPLKAAQDAGFDIVMTRGQFSRDMGKLMAI